jgi:hypothetical protein
VMGPPLRIGPTLAVAGELGEPLGLVQ